MGYFDDIDFEEDYSGDILKKIEKQLIASLKTVLTYEELTWTRRLKEMVSLSKMAT